jgi:hypothetical protein
MKKLNITWADGVFDPTGYLFSFSKALSCALKNSPYKELAEDIIATSGFAFRIWVDGTSLCPSATSIWDFDLQRTGVINGGLTCNYVSRLWDENDIEKERQLQAIEIIKESIDRGIAAVSWDIGSCEWGLIIGYNDEEKTFSTLSISGQSTLSYEKLGKNEIPILSVIAITGINNRSQTEILRDTMKIAVKHAHGDEWCSNEKGLMAYPALIKFLQPENFKPDMSWSIEYYLGTYSALRFYAYKYFEKQNQIELAELYKNIYENLNSAFHTKINSDFNASTSLDKIKKYITTAYELEKKAVSIMQKEVNL